VPTSTLPGPHVEVVIVDAGPTARLLPPVYVSWVHDGDYDRTGLRQGPNRMARLTLSGENSQPSVGGMLIGFRPES
jgi:hypothetical protein